MTLAAARGFLCVVALLIAERTGSRRDIHWPSALLELAAVGLVAGLTLRWLGPHSGAT
jgi:hypothetical protein